MKPALPPPDPYESLDLTPSRDADLPAPLAIFAHGRVSPEGQRLADALLDLRPGLLIVAIDG